MTTETRNVRKSPEMRVKELEFNEKMETLLPRLIRKHRSVAGAARELEIARQTAQVWLRVFDMRGMTIRAEAPEHEAAPDETRNSVREALKGGAD